MYQPVWGFVRELPELKEGRFYHGCGRFINNKGQPVSKNKTKSLIYDINYYALSSSLVFVPYLTVVGCGILGLVADFII